MNRTDGSGRIEEFLDAAYRADNRTISDNLACGLSVDVVDDDNTAALQIAAAQGDLSVVSLYEHKLRLKHNISFLESSLFWNLLIRNYKQKYPAFSATEIKYL